MDFPIEKGRDVPEQRKRGRPMVYPWNMMEPGDSFIVTADQYESARMAGRAWFRRNRPDLRVVTAREGRDRHRIFVVEVE